jgi:hypothetical protein
VQADTIVPEPGNPIGWDHYAYVSNNPILYYDPSGNNEDCGAYDAACRAQVKQEEEQAYWNDYYRNHYGNQNAGTGSEISPSNNQSSGTAIAIQLFTLTSYGLDVAGAASSGINAGIVDTVGGFLIAAGCGIGGTGGPFTVEGGCLGGAAAAWSFDTIYTKISFFTYFDNFTSIVSTVSTAGADYLSGNNQLIYNQNGQLVSVMVGKDTIVSARNALVGLIIPEANIDAGASFSQIWYDYERSVGEKNGGSYNISLSPVKTQEVIDIAKQFFGADWW